MESRLVLNSYSSCLCHQGAEITSMGHHLQFTSPSKRKLIKDRKEGRIKKEEEAEGGGRKEGTELDF